MCSKRLLVGFLALGLFLGQLSAYAAPSPSSSGVTLSQAEYDQIEAAIVQAQEALRASNEKIAQQSKDLTKLWIFSGVLVAVLAVDITAQLIHAIKE